jgi:ribosome biogenesis GTPase
MRELGLWDAGEAVSALFEDVEALAAGCRFSDCAHGGEPGCAVKAALDDGRLDPGRWAGWRKLQKELAHQVRQDDIVAKIKHQRHWIAINKANRARKNQRWE